MKRILAFVVGTVAFAQAPQDVVQQLQEKVAAQETQIQELTRVLRGILDSQNGAASELTAQSESVNDVVAQLAAMVGSTVSKAPRVRQTVSRSNTRTAVPITVGAPRAHAIPRDSDLPEF